MQYQLSSVSGVGASYSQMQSGGRVAFAPLSQDDDEPDEAVGGSYAPPSFAAGMDAGAGSESPAGGSLAERIAARLKEQQQV